MNRNQHDQPYDGFHTRRSEKYRHPEQPRSDDYAQHPRYAPRGDYNDEVFFDRQGNYPDHYDQDQNQPYGYTRTYRNAGSYGSTREEYPPQRRQHDAWPQSYNPNQEARFGQEHDSRGYRENDWQGPGPYSSNQNQYGSSSEWGGYPDRDNNDWDRERIARGHDRKFSDNPSPGRFQNVSMHRYYEEDDIQNERRYLRPENRISRGELDIDDDDFGSLDSNRLEQKPYGISGYYTGGYGSDRF